MADVRDITRNAPIFERSVVSSSVMPSTKYSCSGSWERFSMGNTAMERIAGPRLSNSRARQPPTFAANKTTIRRHAASRIANCTLRLFGKTLGDGRAPFPVSKSRVSRRRSAVISAACWYRKLRSFSSVLLTRDSTSGEMCGLSCDAGIER